MTQDGNSTPIGPSFVSLPPAVFGRLYLAAAGEALVVAGRPAGAVGAVLVLEEAGVRVFLQLLGVLHEQVVELGLLRLPPGPELTVVRHVDLEMFGREKSRDGWRRGKRRRATCVEVEGGRMKERQRRDGGC